MTQPADDTNAPSPTSQELWAQSPLLAFLITDIEDSTGRWETQREAMGLRLRMHDRAIREVVVHRQGRIFKALGDGFCIAFARPTDALAAAVDIQRALAHADWNRADPLSIRMAMHCGTAEERDNDYFGPTVNLAQRLLSLGGSDQLILSGAAFSLLENDLPLGSKVVPLGKVQLKGVQRREAAFRLGLDAVADGAHPVPAVSTTRRTTWRVAVAVAVLAIIIGGGAAYMLSRPHHEKPAVAPPVHHHLPTTAWNQDGHDASHTGYSPLATAITPANTHRLRLLWRAKLSRGSHVRLWSAVTVSGGRVYAGSDSGTWAFQAATGHFLWRQSATGNTSASGPSIVGGRLYVGGSNGVLYALNPRSGSIIWHRATQPGQRRPAPLSSPTVIGGVIYIGSRGGSVWAYRDMGDRAVSLWAANEGTYTTSPTVTRSTVLLGSANGVVALNGSSGSGLPSWHRGFIRSSENFTAPSISENTVFVTASKGTGSRRFGYLYALDLRTGRKLWRFPNSDSAPSRPLAQPATGPGFVYLVSSTGVVSRLDEHTGVRSWTFRAGRKADPARAFWWRPSLVGHVLFVTGITHKGIVIDAIRADNGHLLWRHVLPRHPFTRGGSASEPAAVKDLLVLSTSYRRRGQPSVKPDIYAFRLRRRHVARRPSR